MKTKVLGFRVFCHSYRMSHEINITNNETIGQEYREGLFF